MFDLPEIKRKQPKAPYRKPEAVKELERLADYEARQRHPGMPFLKPRTFRDDNANSLTGCIVTYITLKGGFASRVNNQGTYSRRLGRYFRSTSKKGLPDVLATWKKQSLFIEVKHGADRLSINQKQVRDRQEMCGGKYFVATNFESFKLWFDQI